MAATSVFVLKITGGRSQCALCRYKEDAEQEGHGLLATRGRCRSVALLGSRDLSCVSRCPEQTPRFSPKLCRQLLSLRRWGLGGDPRIDTKLVFDATSFRRAVARRLAQPLAGIPAPAFALTPSRLRLVSRYRLSEHQVSTAARIRARS